ncbi:hypothetical protein Vi05172_g11575 [Venturia inaequalis]|nr:hypothetical protein Vi05172_g11575 [Venturia inaequalis]
MWVRAHYHPLPQMPPPLDHQPGYNQPLSAPSTWEWTLRRRTPVPSEDKFGIQQRPYDRTKYDPLPCPPWCANPASKKVTSKIQTSVEPQQAEEAEEAGETSEAGDTGDTEDTGDTGEAGEAGEAGKAGEGWEARDAWEAGEAWIAGEVWEAGVFGHKDDSGMKEGCSASRANGRYAERELKCIYGHKDTFKERKAHLKHKARQH